MDGQVKVESCVLLVSTGFNDFLERTTLSNKVYLNFDTLVDMFSNFVVLYTHRSVRAHVSTDNKPLLTI